MFEGSVWIEGSNLQPYVEPDLLMRRTLREQAAIECFAPSRLEPRECLHGLTCARQDAQYIEPNLDSQTCQYHRKVMAENAPSCLMAYTARQ